LGYSHSVSRSSRRRRRNVDRRRAAASVASARWTSLAIALTVTLALKVVLALTLAGHPLLQPEGELDAGEYWRLAQRVAGGDILLRGTPFYVSPLYIYWLAVAQAVTSASVAGVLVLQAALGTIAVWLTALTAAYWTSGSTDAPAALEEPLDATLPVALREPSSDKVAAGRPTPRVRAFVAPVVAGGALALTGIVALQEALILQSAIDPLLVAAFALATTRAFLAPTTRRWAVSGATLALLAMNRPNAWLLGLPCMAAFAFLPLAGIDNGGARRRLRYAGIWVLGTALVLAPVAIRTIIATGEWQVLPAHGGLNAYIGNHAGANGTYTVVEGIRPSMAGQREDMRVVAERAAGRALSEAEVSGHFLRAALEWWRDAPAAASRLLAYKMWLATHAWELPVNVSYAWFREHVRLLWLLPLGAWALIPFGLGVSVAGGAMVPGSHLAAWRFFRWLLPTYLVSVALFFVVDRYRAPALVLCAIQLGLLAHWVSDRNMRTTALQASGTRLRVAVATCLAVALGAAGFIRLPFQTGEAEADTRMALHAIDAGHDDEAQAWLTLAVTRHPAPGVAWLRAGLAWQARNDLAHAERALREAYRLDGREPAVAFALGEVLISEGKGAEAVPLLQQAERGGLRPDRVRLDLALARWQAGDQDGARTTLAAGVPREALPLLRARALAAIDAGRPDLAIWLLTEYRLHVNDDAEVVEKLGLMLARRGETAGAAALFEEAAHLDASRPTARFNLAIARAQQGRRGEAIVLLREALRIDPSYAQAAGALRELLGEK
jgi:Flp pilus assembly protein TadD